MTYVVGHVIQASDYNAYATTQGGINEILGDMHQGATTLPDAGFGYGQFPMLPAAVPNGAITNKVWTDLFTAAGKIGTHQDTPVVPPLPGIAPDNAMPPPAGSVIVAYNNTYPLNDAIARLRSNKFNIAPTEYAIVQDVSSTQPSNLVPWGYTLSYEFDAVFANWDNIRYFFNLGGQIIINGDYQSVGGPEDTLWHDMLSALGQLKFSSTSTSFSAGSTSIGFYNLTTSDTELYNVAYGGVTQYANNRLVVSARLSGTPGTTNSVRFTVKLIDNISYPNLTPKSGITTMVVSSLRSSGAIPFTGGISIVPATIDNGFTALAAPPAVSTTTLVSDNNTADIGTPVTFTATVTGAVPTGTVTFSGIAGNPAVALVSGVATYTTSSIPLGTANVSALYSGDANNLPSTSNTVIQHIIVHVQAPTTLVLTSDVNPSTFGDSVTLTATIQGPIVGTQPTGTMTFYIDSSPVGIITMSSLSASMQATSMSVGTHSLTAVYNGDVNFQSSTSNIISQVVNVAAGSATFTTPGTTSWIAPANVTSVDVVCIAAGAGGGQNQSGAGGSVSWKNNIPVTPGNTYSITVGAGGVGDTYIAATEYYYNVTSVASSGWINVIDFLIGNGFPPLTPGWTTSPPAVLNGYTVKTNVVPATAVGTSPGPGYAYYTYDLQTYVWSGATRDASYWNNPAGCVGGNSLFSSVITARGGNTSIAQTGTGGDANYTGGAGGQYSGASSAHYTSNGTAGSTIGLVVGGAGVTTTGTTTAASSTINGAAYGGGGAYNPSAGAGVQHGNGASGAVRILWGAGRSWPSTNVGSP